MPLKSGTRLGPYEIVGPLGAGGMGEVYRAKDSRLGREVALKVLPPGVSEDPGRRARFEQEARAVAALNHPNIVAVYDVGDGYIVSELVAGETLTSVMERGPLSLRRLLDVAVQIADGMAAAHAARIVHRDLKPANIMITPDGRVKILDFGLAKQGTLPSTAPDDTMTVQQTQPGMILGTVHYMSPEQATGKPADHRSDQFSFGLILYEMAAGKKAFDRPETIQTMSAILSDDAPRIEAPIPEPLRWAIDRCLAKDPGERYESSGDLYRELRSMRDHLTGVTGDRPALSPAAAAPAVTVVKPTLPPARKVVKYATGALLLLAAAFSSGLYYSGSKFPDQSAYQFTPFAFEPGRKSNPIWSPDGKAVAYGLRPEGDVGATQIYVRYLNAELPAAVTHIPENAYPLLWAPDSKRILFRSDRKPAGIWSVSPVGGEPESVIPMQAHVPMTMSSNLQSLAFVEKGDDGMYAVWTSSPPGSPKKKYEPDPVKSKALFNETRLEFSPDGKHLLLMMKGERHSDETWLMPYPPDPGKQPKLVLRWMQSFNGTPRFAWMPDSRHVVLSLSNSMGAPAQLWLGDTASEEHMALTSGTLGRGSLGISPNGKQLVFTEYSGNDDVISVDLETVKARKLIATEMDEAMPAWAARKPQMVYTSYRTGRMEIWVHGPDTERPVVTPRDFPESLTQWFMGPALSPEGDRVIYTRIDREGHSRLWISSLAGAAPVPATNDATSAEFPGSWSPDGTWFVYLAIRNGKDDLLKVKTTGQATPVLLASGGSGEVPSWSPSGDLILSGNRLLTPDGTLVRDLGEHHTDNYVFSQNGKLLYGLRSEGDKELLFSVDVATGAERVLGDIGHEFVPRSGLHPAIRFSLAPDGKSFVYSTGVEKSNLWLLEGWNNAASTR